MTTTDIELHEEHIAALQAMNDNEKQFIFLTGNAGTGKSTLIRHFLKTKKQKCVVLAPTGVAANNIGGATIHSFFKLKPSPNYAESSEYCKLQPLDVKTFAALDCIIIDEISMTRSDVMFAINYILEKSNGRAFGGKKIIVVGDMMQLPPVVKADEKAKVIQYLGGIYWFFGLPNRVEITKIELKTIFRQKDSQFVSVLNELRKEKTDIKNVLNTLNERVSEIPNNTIILSSTNETADSINSLKLNELKTKLHTFKGIIEGNFNEKDSIVALEIQLKEGARVMFAANNGTLFKNGELGTIKRIDNDYIEVLKDNKELVIVTQYTWNKRAYQTETKLENGTIETKLIIKDTGSFTQIPLKIGYAITIHKSQGQTFEKVHLANNKSMFAHGQLYVALSRCTTLQGLTMSQPLSQRDIIFDNKAII